MHELSIAGAIAEVAGRQAAGRRVVAVSVRVGHLRQVVPSALEFAFELVVDGTELAGARLELERVPAAGDCHRCGAHTELDSFPLRCAHCGSLDVELTAGEELSVEELEIEEEERMGEAQPFTDDRRKSLVIRTRGWKPRGGNP
jgi:hydrogenase nickel incorporation protein HypA/HybF